ncbi:MAG: acyclic terpene utilization AtuA family protein [Actinomycetes bacterium]
MASAGAATPIRIGNCSGFYGDRFAAMREMLTDGPLDVLTGDYLAELTMLILFRTRLSDPAGGYARTFVRQLEDCFGLAVERGVRIVSNAGGLNPAGLAARVREVASALGLDVQVAHVEGDDLLDRLPTLQSSGIDLANMDSGIALRDAPAPAVTANAYLGAWGIAECLRAGAEVVVTGRVTDASLVVGPAAWHHGWARDDWNALAGAVVTGHVLECGAQATGGNYAFFREVPGLEHVGFPLAEVYADGSSVITKHPGTGGLVSIGTVTAQLLYEISGHDYLGPDVTTRFDTIRLADDGRDRVRISGVAGLPPPPTTKVCINYIGGARNSVTFLLTGDDVDEKAELIRRQLSPITDRVQAADIRLEPNNGADPLTNAAAVARLTITVKDADAQKIGRAFSNACVELALASYPGATVSAPPGDATPYGVYWPALVPSELVPHVAVLTDGTKVEVKPTVGFESAGERTVRASAPAPGGPTRCVPLGTVFGARSGDKGGNANVGVWARDDAGFGWLAENMTVEHFCDLLPETAPYAVDRYLFPNLRALNFVVLGLLGEGVASSTRLDPQAKGLGEWLRARLDDVPIALLGGDA